MKGVSAVAVFLVLVGVSLAVPVNNRRRDGTATQNGTASATLQAQGSASGGEGPNVVQISGSQNVAVTVDNNSESQNGGATASNNAVVQVQGGNAQGSLTETAEANANTDLIDSTDVPPSASARGLFGSDELGITAFEVRDSDTDTSVSAVGGGEASALAVGIGHAQSLPGDEPASVQVNVGTSTGLNQWVSINPPQVSGPSGYANTWGGVTAQGNQGAGGSLILQDAVEPLVAGQSIEQGNSK